MYYSITILLFQHTVSTLLCSLNELQDKKIRDGILKQSFHI